MIFKHLDLSGLCLIEPEAIEDQRGYFERLFCQNEFAMHGLTSQFVQANRSLTRLKGSVRGMHLQREPDAEDKLIRVERGSIFDVAVDFRPNSPTYLEWFGATLSVDNRRMLFVPKGFAHGFQTLDQDVVVSYLVSSQYSPGSEFGLRYNDASLAIDWPIPVSEVSDKDRSWPLLVSNPGAKK